MQRQICMMYNMISLICEILKNATNVDFSFHDHNIVSFSFKTGYQVSVFTSHCTAFLSINGNYCQITSKEHSAVWGWGTPREVVSEGIPSSPGGDAEVWWYIASWLKTPKLIKMPCWHQGRSMAQHTPHCKSCQLLRQQGRPEPISWLL